MDLKHSNVVVILFVMEQCPHCHEYYPTFVEAARKYAGQLPIWVLNANDPEYSETADQFGVSATPAIVIARRNAGAVRVEGTQNAEATDRILRGAMKYV